MTLSHYPAESSRLAVALKPGLPVVLIDDRADGVIVNVTQAQCVYRLHASDTICVARWEELAIAGIRPAKSVLPTDVTTLDRTNVQVSVLRELLALRPLGLTAAQSQALEELLRQFNCLSPPGVS